jgi:dTDP-3-amino-3,4,6-trideoxy-alpha-D-glucose transaminase
MSTTDTTIAFLDLRAMVAEVRDELDRAWDRVISSGAYIMGDEVRAFEREFSAFCDVDQCVTVGSGLDALRLVLEALEIGVGDEVIVPAYTAVATWMAVTAVGARPVGVDVEGTSFSLDPALVASAITSRTKAVIAVHLFGLPADISRLAEITDQHGLALVEDAAQAHGAKHGGRRVGGLAQAAAFSFYPTKNLGAFGDGGAVTCNDPQLADRLRLLRTYGWRERSVSEVYGVNSRLDELQAALLRVRLGRLDDDLRRRRELAAFYHEALCDLEPVTLPTAFVGEHDEPAWHLYPVGLERRDDAQRDLASIGIGSLVHYDPLPHLTPAYRGAGWSAGDFPVAERLAGRELSLPFYPQLSLDSAQAVATALRRSMRA